MRTVQRRACAGRGGAANVSTATAAIAPKLFPYPGNTAEHSFASNTSKGTAELAQLGSMSMYCCRRPRAAVPSVPQLRFGSLAYFAAFFAVFATLSGRRPESWSWRCRWPWRESRRWRYKARSGVSATKADAGGGAAGAADAPSVSWILALALSMAICARSSLIRRIASARGAPPDDRS